MATKNWFVHMGGQTFGPLPTDLVGFLLEENRLQFTDYGWHSGQSEWKRLMECAEFSGFLPVYPTAPIPAAPTAPPAQQLTIKKLEGLRRESRAPITLESRPKRTEIRRHDRVPIEAHALIKEHGRFDVLNVSESGLLLKTVDGLELGIDLRFSLVSDEFGKPMEMTGISVREESAGNMTGIGIEFTRVNPAHKRILQSYVNSKLAQTAKAG